MYIQIGYGLDKAGIVDTPNFDVFYAGSSGTMAKQLGAAICTELLNQTVTRIGGMRMGFWLPLGYYKVVFGNENIGRKSGTSHLAAIVTMAVVDTLRFGFNFIADVST